MFLLVFLIYLTQVPTAHSWGGSTHPFIVQKAIDLMPDDENWFFSTYSNTIAIYSSAPDGWKGSDPFEAARHYYDYDISNGTLPWAVKDNFNMFVQYLRANDWNHAALLAGVIAHYVGDASNPLHATSDYSPGGNHGNYESTVSSYLGGMNMDMPGFVPHELGNVFDSTMQLLVESYGYTGRDTEDQLNYWLAQNIIWNDTIQAITQSRLRTGAQFLADVWYTGMVQAGLVGPKSSVDAITPWRTSIPFTITATTSGSVQSVSLYYRYSTDNSSWGGWTFFGDNSSPHSWSFTAPQEDGYYEFYSIAMYGENVESSPATADARCGVDTLVPASSVDTISPYWRASTSSFQITPTVSDATSGVKDISLYYRYSTDNSSWSAWTLYGTDTVAPWMWSVRAPSGSGYYEFYSIARDKATNAESAPTEADARCGVDTIAPSAPAKSSPADGTTTNNIKPTFTWAAATDGLSGIARYELWVDDDSDFSSPKVLENTADDVTLSLTSPVLAGGNYSWRVIAWDRVGNKSNFEAPWVLSVVTIPRNVEVTISPSAKSVGPGEDVTFTVTVTNTGNAADNYDLTVGDDVGWGATLSGNFLTIPAGESRAVVVGVTVPSDAVEGDSTMITVTATSQADPTVETNTSCIARCLKPAYGVDVSISPASKSGLPGSILTYTVTVKNTGTVSDNYTLVKTDTADWTLTLPSSVTDVAPDEDRQVTLTVRIPATAENDTRDNITVTAASSENVTIENSASCTARGVKNVVGVTSLTISPSRFALYPGYSGQVQALTATLKDSNYNLLANKVITWSATAGRVSPSSGTTDAVGQISVTYTAPIVTTQTSATITASFAGDNLYEASSGTSSGIPAIPVSENISASTGGTVVINVTEIHVTVNLLVVPPNALSENTTITVVEKPIEAPSGYAGVSKVFDIGPSGTTFNIPSTVTLPYDENELPAGVSEDDLAIYCRTSAGGSWELVGGNVDKTANTVSVQIDHLSEYAVMVSISGGGGVGGGELQLLAIGVIIIAILIVTRIIMLIRQI